MDPKICTVEVPEIAVPEACLKLTIALLRPSNELVILYQTELVLVEYIAVEVVLNVTCTVCTSLKGANVCTDNTLAVENVLVT